MTLKVNTIRNTLMLKEQEKYFAQYYLLLSILVCGLSLFSTFPVFLINSLCV